MKKENQQTTHSIVYSFDDNKKREEEIVEMEKTSRERLTIVH
jgi:hypothetical protein